MGNGSCLCEPSEVLIFPCSGASNLGQIANEVALRLREAGTPECQPLYSSDSHADQKVLLEELLTSAGYGHLTEMMG